MALTPTEEARVQIFAVAELARRTLERGLPLNEPEARALICDEMHMAARAGRSFEDVAEAGRSALEPEQVLEGVAEMVSEIRVEVLLEEGSRLIVLRGAVEPRGEAADAPGAVVCADGEVELSPGRERRRLKITSNSEHEVWISSHFPLWQVNHRLELDRQAARGFHLDVPSGETIRWRPGESRTVDAVAYGGSIGEEAG